MYDNIWDDCDYSQKNYIGRPVTEEGLWAAEKILGYKLPEAYKKLLKTNYLLLFLKLRTIPPKMIPT